MDSINALLPPLLVLFLGYTTKRVMLSLCSGIVLAALIANNFKLLKSAVTIKNCILGNLQLNTFLSVNHFTETWNLFICIFLLCLGIFVVMLQMSGGAQTYITKIRGRVSKAQHAEESSIFLSFLLFIDDYFSSLTVGSIMRPLTDSYKIPRAKLAFLVDSMAAPLAILCPFSSWVAAIIGFLKDNGINQDTNNPALIVGSPVTAYINILPFLFYSFIMIVSTIFIVKARVSFGPMHAHEIKAVETGQLLEQENKSEKNFNREIDNASIFDFIIPVVMLLFFVLSGVLYSGGWFVFGMQNSTIIAFQNSSAAYALFLGGLFSVLFTTSYFLAKKRFTVKELPSMYYNGIIMMLPAVVVLMLAWSLGDLLRTELHTGEHIANLLSNRCDINILPCILFLLATLISFAIGSSWGTAAMLFPIVIPMTVGLIHPGSSSIPLAEASLLYPILGAVLSGCVAGDHISPISDTTVMSSTSSGSPLMEHVKTQIPYTIPAIIATAIAFLIAPHMIHLNYILVSTVCVCSALFISCSILKVLSKKQGITTI
ncbi:MAG: hypothetical protein HOI53_05740, partial [Francisellaceae bacterium]|jgi:tetracycline resistance efflux pump|nr:hypothetical protein [Francisellaceae bacterium]MBT6207510.1 hypothetical protein [Francisellaceae bacterium]MBT6538828.1 hypothetical protein [Francisellaceae bacterium]